MSNNYTFYKKYFLLKKGIYISDIEINTKLVFLVL